MRLEPFDPAQAATVAGWATTPDETLMWCGYRDGLVPADEVRRWGQADDTMPFGLHDDHGRLVGYGEVWVDDEEEEVELARLIVDPDRRGAGLGRALVTALAREARTRHPTIFLRVHPANAAALACYAGAGFVPVEASLADEWNAPQPVRYHWLTHP